MKSIKILAVSMLLIVLGLLAGCGGSTGSTAAIPPSTKVSGVAATGTPIAGTVYLKDSANPARELSQTINADGSFSFDVSGMTAPFILKAVGADSNGVGVTFFSFANSTGTANINPLSHLAVLQASGGADLTTIYSGATAAQLAAIQAALSNASSQIQTLFAPIFTDYGVAGRNFISDSYQANHTGFDLLFDLISFQFSGGTLTLTNKVSGATVLVTSAGGSTLTGTVTTSNLPTIPPSDSLFGTYTLSGFEIYYTTGSSITSTSPSITSFSGTFKLYSNNTASQTITVNGAQVNINASWSYNAATQQFTFVAFPSGATSVLTVSFSGNVLTTACPSTGFTEYDHWTKTSNHVARMVAPGLEEALLSPTGAAGSLAGSLLGGI
ncbi:MAG TPA: hypothetical protein VJ550_13590 [Geomonas sp.]|nr:hypothetical protein [Geomonas sp.]